MLKAPKTVKIMAQEECPLKSSPNPQKACPQKDEEKWIYPLCHESQVELEQAIIAVTTESEAK